ncbi:hypothetical protein SKAU_G00292430 [Synaphobranchus kaupii]|uniref:Uncharacterized protein n=1 Tax=Synaphobranchus kaupii TaxID=118154 RepID=A0A9Q1EU31_SYNKA|nr:hypothetical protein SKAU_G00292430 [Synaphobranchus kaupii]
MTRDRVVSRLQTGTSVENSPRRRQVLRSIWGDGELLHSHLRTCERSPDPPRSGNDIVTATDVALTPGAPLSREGKGKRPSLAGRAIDFSEPPGQIDVLMERPPPLLKVTQPNSPSRELRRRAAPRAKEAIRPSEGRAARRKPRATRRCERL